MRDTQLESGIQENRSFGVSGVDWRILELILEEEDVRERGYIDREPLSVSCGQGNSPSGTICGEFLDYLRDCWLRKVSVL
jgi:hypothetical protein